MATVPDTHDFTDGVSTSSEMNTWVRDPIRFLLNKPLARLRSNAAQSIATGTYTSILFQAEDADTDPDGVGGHDTVTNTSRFTARYAGWYSVSGTAYFAANATARRGIRVAVNGTATNAAKTLLINAGALSMALPLSEDLVYLNVGDYVELQALQDSGGNLNIGSASADDNSRMCVKWERN